MWDVRELKKQSKEFLRSNYVNALFVTFILGLLNAYNKNPLIKNISEDIIEASSNTLLTVVLLGVLSILFKVFIVNPIIYGGDSFFVRGVSSDQSDISDLANAFREGNYAHIVKTMVVRDIFLILWMLLPLIPILLIVLLSDIRTDAIEQWRTLYVFIFLPLFIFKFYQYRFIPFILDDYPEMPSLEIIRKSKEISKGNKFGMFILDLSFTGWYLLAVLLLVIGVIIGRYLLASILFIIGIIIIQPYHHSTIAFLYLELEEFEE